MDSDILPAFAIAKKLNVSRQLVYSWVKAGKLKPVDHAPDGRPLYRYLDAAVVDREARRSPFSHRIAAA